MAEQFVTCNVEEIIVGEELPVDLYIYLDFRFITFRAAGDVVDRPAYDRLEFKKVRNLFIKDGDRKKFNEWAMNVLDHEPKPLAPANKGFARVREDVHRKTYDIFQAIHPDKIVSSTISASKNLVTEVMKFPYAVHTLGQLQTYSRGTVDHSVNVSVLSVYLAMQMGYSHNIILQHVGMGGLLHEIGKPKVVILDEDQPADIELKMQQHPVYGLQLLEGQSRVPNEVKMIVAQHHECNDGTGYPKKLRGSGIYDLARIVGIANVFDEVVSDGSGTLLERQRSAIQHLDQVLYKKFDPQKLEKSLKILKMAFDEIQRELARLIRSAIA